MSDEVIGHCWNCGQALGKLDYGRETNCIGCGKSTRCCRNCRHYAPGRPNACVEPMVERVLDKTAANFCELFEPTSPAAEQGSGAPKADLLQQAAEDLFK
ncbi:hypothetical protein G3480_09865 [Thiorhodococcus mannitoliphagus]|uniref:Uncharacterized protein n=1 Tax=Thiorhodococcus mannitoliphagus TaxID=329406 RepID=A0A6P1DT18_9GAMM|nr:hypothetical protein [Thiorhodococcus mannitoliphagus]NEX20610.1 hypothetical protein [Thiorhodococcus mannitoliphagus]